MDPSFGHDGDCHNDYHLQFVKDNCDAEFPNEINVALKWMFAGPPPLTYLAHQVQQSDGEPIVVLVKFQLSASGYQNHTSFEDAGKELCKRLFRRDVRRLLPSITPKSILGVSAVSRTWRIWFAQAFFTAGVSEGIPFVQEVAETCNDEWLPSWALVFLFTITSKVDISMFLENKIGREDVMRFFEEINKHKTGDIIARFTEKKSGRPLSEIRRDQRVYLTIFKERSDAFIEAMRRFTTERRSQQSSQYLNYNAETGLTCEAAICDALYDLELSAAKLATNSIDALDAFRDGQTQMMNSMAINGAMALSNLPLYGILQKYASTLRVAAATSMSPEVLSALELAGETGSAVSTSIVQPGLTYWAIFPLAMSVAYNGYQGCMRWKEKKKYEKLVKFSEEIQTIVLKSWMLAYDTRVYLEYVHSVTIEESGEVSTNEETYEQWEDFMSRIRRDLGPRATERNLTPLHLLVYMEERRQELEQMRSDMTEKEQIVLSADLDF